MKASIRASAEALVDSLRQRVVSRATSPFGHAPYPLEHTLSYMGDPGLLGPDSVSWAVIGDVAAFVGGVRGLLIQAAHPEVVAGVGDHSRYRDDPLGRLSRTSAYVTATTYGAMPEVEAAVNQVKRIHKYVNGISSRGIEYSADDPGFSAWVHNALTDSFLTAHRVFGGISIDDQQADRFVVEQQAVGRLMGSDPMPSTASSLSSWIAEHPALASSPEMRDAIDFLTDPPLEPTIRIGYRLIKDAAVSTLPDRLIEILGLNRPRAGWATGQATTKALRWALGYSPSWEVALRRVDADVPVGLFIQEPRVA